MAKDSKGQEIEAGDVVSVHFKVTHVYPNSLQLRRVIGGGRFTCTSDSGEISIVKKVEKPLVIGDKICISAISDDGVTRTIVAFDGDKIVYRTDCKGSHWYTGAPASSCKLDPRVTPKDDV